MRTSQAHKVICDGKFTVGNKIVMCNAELHPETKAVINRNGILGHHCDFCHDPARTALLATKLGKTEPQLRKMGWEAVVEASDAMDAKASDDAAKAQEKLRKAEEAKAEEEAKKQEPAKPTQPANWGTGTPAK